MSDFETLSFSCRVLRTVDEVNNVTKLRSNETIVLATRTINYLSFEPEIVFFVGVRNRTLKDMMCYKADNSLIQKSDAAKLFDKLYADLSSAHSIDEVSLVTNQITIEKKRLDEKNAERGTGETLEAPFKRLNTYAGDIKYSKLREAIEEWDSQDNTTF